MTGKRKRDGQRVARVQEVVAWDTAAQTSDVFRQCFESRFEPLQDFSTITKGSLENNQYEHSSSDSASVSDWDGLSGDEYDPQIEIINFGEKQESPRSTDDLKRAKAFMVR